MNVDKTRSHDGTSSTSSHSSESTINNPFIAPLPGRRLQVVRGPLKFYKPGTKNVGAYPAKAAVLHIPPGAATGRAIPWRNSKTIPGLDKSCSSSSTSTIKFADVHVTVMTPPRKIDTDWRFDKPDKEEKNELRRLAEKSRLYFQKYGRALPEELFDDTPNELLADLEQIERERRAELKLRREMRNRFPKSRDD